MRAEKTRPAGDERDGTLALFDGRAAFRAGRGHASCAFPRRLRGHVALKGFLTQRRSGATHVFRCVVAPLRENYF